MAENTNKPEIEKSDAFSEDVYSSSKPGQAASAPMAESTILSEQEEFREEPLRDLPRTPSHSAPKNLNGITWKKKRRIARRDIITLNNGEPLSFAIRKIVVELVIVALCAAVAIGFFFAREFVVDKLTDDGIGSLSMSARYEIPHRVEVAPLADQASPGYACIGMIGAWAGIPVDSAQLRQEYDGRDITGLADGMEKELIRAVTNKTVTRKENLTNHTLLVQVYDSLAKGAPAVVACTAPDGKAMAWALVTGLNTKEDKVSLIYSDGTATDLTMSDFVKSARYETLTGTSLGTRLALAAGIHNKNTAFFFTPVEE